MTCRPAAGTRLCSVTVSWHVLMNAGALQKLHIIAFIKRYVATGFDSRYGKRNTVDLQSLHHQTFLYRIIIILFFLAVSLHTCWLNQITIWLSPRAPLMLWPELRSQGQCFLLEAEPLRCEAVLQFVHRSQVLCHCSTLKSRRQRGRGYRKRARPSPVISPPFPILCWATAALLSTKYLPAFTDIELFCDTCKFFLKGQARDD